MEYFGQENSGIFLSPRAGSLPMRLVQKQSKLYMKRRLLIVVVAATNRKKVTFHLASKSSFVALNL
jgi:hypothetical protein